MSRRTRRAKPHVSIVAPPSEPSGSTIRSGLPLAALLLASGATALVFETLWVKQLGRVVGVEVHAVSVALCAFFAGLALGGAAFGRLADRSPRPIRLYGRLEAGAAVLGFLTTLALSHSAPPYVALQDAVGPLAWLLPFSLVGLPAFLMGGTLPALLRAVRPGDDTVAQATGFFYGANTLGAVLGTLATPFVLVPLLGITLSALVVALVGLAVAAVAFVLDRRAAPSGDSSAPPAQPPSGAHLALALYAGAGGIALGYEVVWSELLVPFLSTRAHAFAVMLATYLAGLAIGSLLFARWSGGKGEPWRAFGLLLGGAAASAVGTVFVLGDWLPQAQTFAGTWAMRLTGRETIEVMARFVLAATAVLLLPTMFLGAAFPAAARLVAGAACVGRDVGRIAAVNTAGGIAGSLVTGFVLVPRLGLVRSIGVLAVAGAVLASIAILKGGREGRRAPALAIAVLLVVATFSALIPRDRLATLWAGKRGGRLLFYEEDPGGTVAVLEQSAGRGTFRRLYIQGVSNSGDAPASLRYMRLQALLPLLVHRGEPRSALVVGFGTGITAGALLAEPALDRRVVFELLPSVVRAGPLFSGNLGAATDARLEIRIGDGRQELLRRSERYDVITLEPPPPSAAGVANLYSRDFYELARSRLQPDGLMAQWWPLPAQNDEDSRSLVRSFLDVFPHASAWTTELHEVLLVGSLSPLELEGARVEKRWAQPEVKAALAEVGVESAAALLATWLTDRTGLERYAGNSRPVTDDRPRIEHAAWVRRGELRRVLPRLLELASDVPLRPEDPLRAPVEAERRELLGLYRFSLHLMAGDRAAAGAALRGVLARDPRNPYYLWVAYGEP